MHNTFDLGTIYYFDNIFVCFKVLGVYKNLNFKFFTSLIQTWLECLKKVQTSEWRLITLAADNENISVQQYRYRKWKFCLHCVNFILYLRPLIGKGWGWCRQYTSATTALLPSTNNRDSIQSIFRYSDIMARPIYWPLRY